MNERERFSEILSRALPLPVENIDTDQIIPARFLKVTDKEGLADALFADWRKDPGFVLNRPQAQGARILVAGDNFGCGSSREHAPWALQAWGFRAVVSSRFADIFRNNALKNGLLPVTVAPAALKRVLAFIAADPSAQFEIDLAQQVLVLPTGMTVRFPVDAFSKKCLLEGVDELGYLLGHEAAIAAYEARREGAAGAPGTQEVRG
jgi:3-isopropylmalate/(R)-2-methylmalate dehydratase small subunit